MFVGNNNTCFDASITILACIDEVVALCVEIISRYDVKLFDHARYIDPRINLAQMIVNFDNNFGDDSWSSSSIRGNLIKNLNLVGDDIDNIFYTILSQLTLMDNSEFAFAGSYELSCHNECLGCFIKDSNFPSFVLTTDATFRPELGSITYVEVASIWVEHGQYSMYLPYEQPHVPNGWKVARLLKKIPNCW